MVTEIVQCPATCIVRKINFKAGDPVKEDEVLCVVEAMKMETYIVAPVSGVIQEVKVSDGQSARAGDALFVIETQS